MKVDDDDGADDGGEDDGDVLALCPALVVFQS